MKCFGLLGESLSHSFSPELHKIIFKHLGTEGSYELLEMSREEVKSDFLTLLVKYHGLNVTIPYKKEIMSFLDDNDKISSQIGAVNTIKISKDKLIGYNTDYYGFGYTLDKYNVVTKGKTAYIIGTGGASRAVYHYLVNHGIGEISFINRRVNTHWAKDCRILTYEELINCKGDIIINCTPVGMSPDKGKSPVKKDTLQGFETAIDLIYNPKETLFLQYALELQLKAINGLYMLVSQGVKSQEIWSDEDISKDIIDKVYEEISQRIYS